MIVGHPEVAFCRDIPSHEKIPNPGNKNPETRKNPTPADFSRIFEFQIPIPEILDFWDFALGIFPGFFDQDRNKKIGIPKKSHPEQALVDITKSLVAVIVINTEFDKDEMFENKFAVTF